LTGLHYSSFRLALTAVLVCFLRYYAPINTVEASHLDEN
jgi:hypothetical protein